MANTAILFGVLLIVLGVGGYVLTGTESWTALIPAIFGVVIGLLGVIGRAPARRKLTMHVALGVALLGALGPAVRLGRAMAGGTLEWGAAQIAQAIMLVLCVVFIALGVRSFVAARRGA